MKNLGMIEMRAQQDSPEIIEGLERARLAKNDKVEQAIILACVRRERQAQRIARQIEDEDRGSFQCLRGVGIKDLHVNRREAVGET